jgi:4-amino-4-deoxy-L-arabinose transferase-like glycosyltransferase
MVQDPSSTRKGWAPAWLSGRARALAWLALVLLVCLLRWPNAERPIRDVDESVSVLIANAWLDGEVPYRDEIDQRGPVTYALYALVFAVAGRSNLFAVHLALLLLVLAGAWLAERTARQLGAEEHGHAWGLLAALFVVVGASTYRRSQMLAFHTEWPTLVLSTFGFLLLWRALRPAASERRRSLGLLFEAGIAFGCSFLAKQPAVFDGLAAGGFLLLLALAERRLFERATWLRAAALAGGFVATVGACVLYFWAAGALADFYLYFWSYNVEHYTAVVPVADRLAALNPWAHSRHYLRSNPLFLVSVVVAVVLVVRAWVLRWRRLERRDEVYLLLVLWTLGAYFGASYSGRNFGHYFIQILAPCALLAARVVVDAWHAAGTTEAWKRPARLALGLAVVGALGFSLHRYHEDFWLFERRQPAPKDIALDALVAWLRGATRPDEAIFVWGYQPEVYVLADRKPASRYSNTNYLTGLLPWENSAPGLDTSEHIVPGSWDILLRELEASRPAVIVDTVPGNHRFYEKYPLAKYPRLASFLAAGYERVKTIPDRKGRPCYDVYLRRGRVAERPRENG